VRKSISLSGKGIRHRVALHILIDRKGEGDHIISEKREKTKEKNDRDREKEKLQLEGFP